MPGSPNISSTEFVYKEATNYSKPVFFLPALKMHMHNLEKPSNDKHNTFQWIFKITAKIKAKI